MSDYLPDDPADRYPLTDDMFAYAELRADIEAQRGDWPAGSAMHVWADELVEIMDRNETYQAAWLTWLKPHEQGLAAGEPVSDAVEAARARILAGYRSTKEAAAALEAERDGWHAEDDTKGSDGSGDAT